MSNTSPTQITYVGHATVLIEINGVRLLTDPILRDRIWHLRRQEATLKSAWTENIDAVLISHLHWDHLDVASLRRLSPKTLVIVPAGAGRLLARKGFNNVVEMAVGQSMQIDGVSIVATPANHNGNRPFAPTIDSLGFIINGDHTVYFAGDTDLFPEMANLTDTLDVALLPVWGWGPTLGNGHMNPYRAAKALQMLQPRLAIPIHWGTFFPVGLSRLLPEMLSDPPHTFSLFAAGLAEEVDTLVLSPGHNVSLAEALTPTRH